MRKREILGIILTLLLLVLTNKHWLIFKPMPVSFQVKGNGDYTFTVQLNKKDNNEFQKVKQCTIKKHLSGGYQKCECQIDRVRFPKRFRIVVNTPNLSPIEIKDISLKNGKYKFPSVSHFALNNAQLGQDSLVPSSSTFSLTYKEKLPVRSGIKFDALPFIIIAILGYLLSYKLTSYLADFKTEKKYSRIDIIFLAVCTVIMFLPMSHISDAKKSDAENRNLAVWKPFINKKGQINYNFGRDYDKWFNDRFNFRNFYLTLKIFFFYHINNYVDINQGYLIKATGEIVPSADIKRKSLKEKQIKESIAGLQRFKAFCDKNNIVPYFIILTRKTDLYKTESLPFNSHKQELEDIKLINRLQRESGIEMIYPYEIFRKNMYNERINYKTDAHFTDYATFLYYNVIIDSIQKQNPNICRLTMKDFDIDKNNTFVKLNYEAKPGVGDYYRFSTMNLLPNSYIKKTLKDRYPLYTYKNLKNVRISKFQLDKDINVTVYDTKMSNRPNLFLTGTSNTPTFAKIASYSFNKTVMVQMRSGYPETFNLKRYKKLIKESGASILIGVYSVINFKDFSGF